MNQADITFWWLNIGSATAFGLAILRVIEFYNAHRPSFKVGIALTSDEDRGNIVTLLNRSTISANISYYDLAWTERRTLFGCPIPFTRKLVADHYPLDPEDG